jgi:uncharacterized protein YwgA
MSNIDELKMALANARNIAAKHIDSADNIDIHDICESLERMISDLETIGEFQTVEDMEEKEFLITEIYPATVVKKYRVKARTEEEAEMKVLEENIEPFWVNTDEDTGEMEVDIKPYQDGRNN